MTSGTKIVFFGNERIATGVKTSVPVLIALVENGYEVAAVVTNYETGTSRSSRDLEIAKVAKQHNIPVLIPNKLTDIKQQLANYQATVGILVAYGKIVPQEIIDIFPKGIVNIHPSLLPKHRGPTPLETAIIDGDDKTGVSLMLLVKDMDAGPILVQRTVHLKGTETKQELADNLLQLGKKLLVENLQKYITGDIKPHNQPHPDRATYSRKISKSDGYINDQEPAELLERKIRAHAGWPGSRIKTNESDLIVIQASVIRDNTSDFEPSRDDASKSQIRIKTPKDTLVIERVKPAGKTEMSAADYIRGYLR